MTWTRQGERCLRGFCCGLLLVLAVGCTPFGWRGGQTVTSRLPLELCQVAAPGALDRLPARCTKVRVFEDRAAQRGRTIDLHVAVFPSIKRTPEPDPFFFLAGGPGQAASEAFLTTALALAPINEERDIVLVDQRGTGRSNPLRCPLPQGLEFLEYDEQAQRERLRGCLTQLDADPRLYHTAIAMDDLDQVRDAMGYERINLLGVSYGTRAALAYARQYPSRVRTLVLDGVAPPDWEVGPSLAEDAQRAIDLLFARCAADRACAERFPDLPSALNRLLARVDPPVRVEVPHPTSGRPTSVPLDRELVAGSLRLLSYTPESAALLPLIIHYSDHTGDLRPLAAQALLLLTSAQDTVAAGMQYSVLCAEDAPYFGRSAASSVRANTFLGDTVLAEYQAICEVWPAGSVPPGYKEPVRTDAPVLLLSGEMDPVTPPANAERAARTLPNYRHVVAPAMGHMVTTRGCIPTLITTFIRTGQFERLEVDCVSKIQPPPFFHDFSGPLP